MFLETQEVIAKTGCSLLKSGHEKSNIIPATIYLMGIILNPSMNEKWNAWLGSMARLNCICIGNVNTEEDALAQITVTATKQRNRECKTRRQNPDPCPASCWASPICSA